MRQIVDYYAYTSCIPDITNASQANIISGTDCYLLCPLPIISRMELTFAAKLVVAYNCTLPYIHVFQIVIIRPA